VRRGVCVGEEGRGGGWKADGDYDNDSDTDRDSNSDYDSDYDSDGDCDTDCDSGSCGEAFCVAARIARTGLRCVGAP